MGSGFTLSCHIVSISLSLYSLYLSYLADTTISIYYLYLSRSADCLSNLLYLSSLSYLSTPLTAPVEHQSLITGRDLPQLLWSVRTLRLYTPAYGLPVLSRSTQIFMLPRALLLYKRKAAAKAHDEACKQTYCLIPDALLRTRDENTAFPVSKAVLCDSCGRAVHSPTVHKVAVRKRTSKHG
jgi:hypothetical protein